MSSSFSMRVMLMSVLIEAAVFMVTEVRAARILASLL